MFSKNILPLETLNRHPQEKRIMIVDDQIYNIDGLKAILHYKLKLDLNYIDIAMNGK